MDGEKESRKSVRSAWFEDDDDLILQLLKFFCVWAQCWSYSHMPPPIYNTLHHQIFDGAPPIVK